MPRTPALRARRAAKRRGAACRSRRRGAGRGCLPPPGAFREGCVSRVSCFRTLPRVGASSGPTGTFCMAARRADMGVPAACTAAGSRRRMHGEALHASRRSLRTPSAVLHGGGRVRHARTGGLHGRSAVLHGASRVVRAAAALLPVSFSVIHADGQRPSGPRGAHADRRGHAARGRGASFTYARRACMRPRRACLRPRRACMRPRHAVTPARPSVTSLRLACQSPRWADTHGRRGGEEPQITTIVTLGGAFPDRPCFQRPSRAHGCPGDRVRARDRPWHGLRKR